MHGDLSLHPLIIWQAAPLSGDRVICIMVAANPVSTAEATGRPDKPGKSSVLAGLTRPPAFQPLPRLPEPAVAHAHLFQIRLDERDNIIQLLHVAPFSARHMCNVTAPRRSTILFNGFFEPNLDNE